MVRAELFREGRLVGAPRDRRNAEAHMGGILDPEVPQPTEVVVRFNQPVLKRCGGRMEKTAALPGLARKGLYLKRQRFGIEPPESATVSI